MKKSEFENRNFGLDLLRCIAVLSVITCHGLTAFLDHGELRTATWLLASHGVDLFFVLSGFLIGSIIIKINSSPEKTTFELIKNFWIRRWFRTLPNYFLFMLLYLLFNLRYSLYTPFTKLPLFFVFLQNAFTEPPLFYKISWSLSIEEWFYLTFPMVLLLIQHFVTKDKIKILLFTIGFFIIICLTGRILVSLTMKRSWEEGTRMLMPIRLDSIAFGVFAAMLKFYKKEYWEKYKNIFALTGFIAFTGMSLIFYFTLLKDRHLYGDFFMNTFFFSITSLSIALLLPFFHSIQIKSFAIIKYLVTYISLVSYSVYLIHPFFRNILAWRFGQRFSGLTLLFFLFVLSFAGAHLTYNLFEKRMTKLRDKFGETKDVVHV